MTGKLADTQRAGLSQISQLYYFFTLCCLFVGQKLLYLTGVFKMRLF